MIQQITWFFLSVLIEITMEFSQRMNGYERRWGKYQQIDSC